MNTHDDSSSFQIMFICAESIHEEGIFPSLTCVDYLVFFQVVANTCNKKKFHILSCFKQES